MTHRNSSGRRGFTAPAATAALVVLLATMAGGIGQVFASSDDAPTASVARAAPSGAQTATLPTRSRATRLRIAALGVDSRLVGLDTTPDGTMELPPATGAGWYVRGAAPGQSGLTILAGYIRRSRAEPGVFARLHRLQPGDEIVVRREDGHRATYRVTAIEAYAVGQFPTDRFYRSDGRPALRIVTTGGRLAPRSPQGNVVVDASLTDVR